MRAAHVGPFTVLIASVLLVVGSATSLSASPVTMAGGFTSFTGVSSGGIPGATPTASPGCDVTFRAVMAGVPLIAPSCTGSGISGPASLVFTSMLSTVEFYEQQAPPGSFPDLQHNVLSFTPAATQEVEIGEYFKLGTLSFTNGIWYGVSTANRFHIEVTTSSGDPLLDGHVLSDDIMWGITPNSASNTPQQNADYIFLSRYLSMTGAIWAYEAGVLGKSNTTTAELWGRIGSLTPGGFENVTGGFHTSGLDPTETSVPEPMTLVLVGTGLAAITRRARKT